MTLGQTNIFNKYLIVNQYFRLCKECNDYNCHVSGIHTNLFSPSEVHVMHIQTNSKADFWLQRSACASEGNFGKPRCLVNWSERSACDQWSKLR
jgi:hypothetical protein